MMLIIVLTLKCALEYLDEIHQKNDYVILIHIFKTSILPLFSYGAVADEGTQLINQLLAIVLAELTS